MLLFVLEVYFTRDCGRAFPFFIFVIHYWIQIRLLGYRERWLCFHISAAIFASTDETSCTTELPPFGFHSHTLESRDRPLKFSYRLFGNQGSCGIWVTFLVKLGSISHLCDNIKSCSEQTYTVCSCGFWQEFQWDSRLSGT